MERPAAPDAAHTRKKRQLDETFGTRLSSPWLGPLRFVVAKRCSYFTVASQKPALVLQVHERQVGDRHLEVCRLVYELVAASSYNREELKDIAHVKIAEIKRG